MDAHQYLQDGRGSGGYVKATTSDDSCNTLQQLLEKVASSHPARGLLMYPPGSVTEPTPISYGEVYSQAREKSTVLQSLDSFKPGKPILLHVDTHWQMILWFWAALFAGAVPVPSPPFSNVAEHRQKHIQSLGVLLESPICLTTTKLLGLFDCDHSFEIVPIDTLADQQPSRNSSEIHLHSEAQNNDLAALMLTSGSTGTAKAVPIRHRQVLAAVAGKNGFRELPKDNPFLNWIGLDHVAGLTELHLHALYHGVDQIHVQASDIVWSPRLFLDLLSRHKVSRTFAPNFFLAKLVSTIQERSDSLNNAQEWDLASLKWLVSGGEANDIETCTSVSRILTKYGAPGNVLSPGFGMTETCAGAIYNQDCPAYDVHCQRAFASLGKCIKGIEMRITTEVSNCNIKVLDRNVPGNLEVHGDLVLQGYYHNETATAEAFTQDGWFRTGDQAIIDSEGNLCLIGRVKDTMNINGVKVDPSDMKANLEQELGQSVSDLVCFASRATAASTEQVTVAFVPTKWPLSVDELGSVHDKIGKACVLATGSKPAVLALENDSLLPKTSLGKILKSKMRSLFENGVFDEQIQHYNEVIEIYRAKHLEVDDITEFEARLLLDFTSALPIPEGQIGVNTPIFEMGITSIDLIRLKRQIDTRLSLDLPIITLMNCPTARTLSPALQALKTSQATTDSTDPIKAYNPVVTLRQTGTKHPLWLIHPGVGEVLIFLALSTHLPNRPIHALRARGFDNEPFFSSIEETITTYHGALKSVQPNGPYAIAGYSYGTMLAFELAKKLEANNDKVHFLGSFNLPPHIKHRMRQLTWTPCLLHLVQFLDLMPESRVEVLLSELASAPRSATLAAVLQHANPDRMQDLDLSPAKLAHWADLAFALQSMAADYEPAGKVACLDVFHAEPLRVAARSRDEWVDVHLAKWREFVRGEVRFHRVEGAHYTMLGPDFVRGFAGRLEGALGERGV